MIWRVRRVVTGHTAGGKSTFIIDGQAPNVMEMKSMPGLALTDLWETTRAPASNAGDADAAARAVRLEPPRAGTIVRIVEFPPDAMWRGRADAREAFESIQAAHAPDASSHDPMMHKTNTVDYIIVLRGEIVAIMDIGETLLKAGDVLIQRGTNHSWSVRGNEPCVIAAVLVSADPLGGRAAKREPQHAARGAMKRAARKPARRPAARKAAKRAAPRKKASGKAAARKRR
ncbi:MAG: cupin domain-containing protein [Burkholderiales bacterium]|nr:cupin domain-containing protein [Burkholderiales bacterium]